MNSLPLLRQYTFVSTAVGVSYSITSPLITCSSDLKAFFLRSIVQGRISAELPATFALLGGLSKAAPIKPRIHWLFERTFAQST